MRLLVALLFVGLACVGAYLPGVRRLGFFPSSIRVYSSVIDGDAPGNVHTAPLSPTSSAFATYVAKTRPLLAALSASLLAPVVALAADSAAAPAAPAVEKVVLGPPPTDFGLNYKEFYEDCNKVVNHMRYAVQMEKGDPNIAAVAQATKDEMLDYVSYYRRFSGINGKQSFSLLYTSINVLAGHYTSYGVKYPVPEKRRKRLLQEFLDIEKNIRKKR